MLYGTETRTTWLDDGTIKKERISYVEGSIRSAMYTYEIPVKVFDEKQVLSEFLKFTRERKDTDVLTFTIDKKNIDKGYYYVRKGWSQAEKL